MNLIIKTQEPLKEVTDNLKEAIKLGLKDKEIIALESLETTYETFDSKGLPSKNYNTFPSNKFRSLDDGYTQRHADIKNYIRNAIKILGAERTTNAIVYPPQSYMGWHTNSDIPGKRIYYTFSTKSAVFKYIHPFTKEVLYSKDKIGWNCREFVIDATNPLWHCIYSEGLRFSFGFNVKNV